MRAHKRAEHLEHRDSWARRAKWPRGWPGSVICQSPSSLRDGRGAEVAGTHMYRERKESILIGIIYTLITLCTYRKGGGIRGPSATSLQALVISMDYVAGVTLTPSATSGPHRPHRPRGPQRLVGSSASKPMGPPAGWPHVGAARAASRLQLMEFYHRDSIGSFG